MYKSNWYHKNKEEINRKRRERYKTDENYRQAYLDRRKNWRENNIELDKKRKKIYRETHKDKCNELSKKWMKQRTKYVYEQLGNKCYKCGFDKFPVLQIHHINGEKIRKFDWFKLDYDLTKLVILCANCHMIHHYQDNCRKD